MAFNERGPMYDREWMVVGVDGRPFTLRSHPELATVQPTVQDGALYLQSRIGTVSIALDKTGQEVPVRLQKTSGTGTDQGAEADKYLTELTRKEARLLRIKQPRQLRPAYRASAEGWSDTVSFADSTPLLLTCVESLRKLNEGIGPVYRVGMERFRPNIVVEGASAYAEDYWRQVSIGDVSATVVRACARCPVVDIHQYFGVAPPSFHRDVMRELHDTRRGLDSGSGEKPEVFFGQNLVHRYVEGSTISLGDPVVVTASSDYPNFVPLPSAYRTDV